MSEPKYLSLTSIEKARILEAIKVKIPQPKREEVVLYETKDGKIVLVPDDKMEQIQEQQEKEMMKRVNEERESEASRSSQGTS